MGVPEKMDAGAAALELRRVTGRIGAEVGGVTVSGHLDTATVAAIRQALLKHKVLFGSDYPLITPDRWLADFEQIAIKPEVRPLILKENAIKLLGLDRAGL